MLCLSALKYRPFYICNVFNFSKYSDTNSFPMVMFYVILNKNKTNYIFKLFQEFFRNLFSINLRKNSENLNSLFNSFSDSQPTTYK